MGRVFASRRKAGEILAAMKHSIPNRYERVYAALRSQLKYLLQGVPERRPQNHASDLVPPVIQGVILPRGVETPVMFPPGRARLSIVSVF